MNLFKLFDPKLLGVIAFGGIVSVAAAGFAAANTVPATQAGDGNAAITGYTITDVTYVLAASDPTKVDQVKFKITGSTASNPATLQAKLDNSTWTANCASTRDGSGVYTCDISPDVAVSGATNLQIVAAQ